LPASTGSWSPHEGRLYFLTRYRSTSAKEQRGNRQTGKKGSSRQFGKLKKSPTEKVGSSADSYLANSEKREAKGGGAEGPTKQQLKKDPTVTDGWVWFGLANRGREDG